MTIQVGDKVPSINFKVMTEEGPKDHSSDEVFAGKKVVFFAVPGAFTPGCSMTHLPGFVVNADAIKAKGVDTIACMSVNDAFVMGAWGKAQNAEEILLLADGNGEYTSALGLELDASGFGMGHRALRFSMIVEDGTVTQLGIEECNLNDLKERQSQDKENDVKTPSLTETVGRTPPPDPKAESWAEKNEWFGKDSAMTYTAFDYHKKLTEQEGFDPNSAEYYAEIDKRMRLDFPHKFGRTESQDSTKLTQTVASAKRSVKPSRRTVRLTSSQVAIAKKLGVPLEEYAKQLKITKEV